MHCLQVIVFGTLNTQTNADLLDQGRSLPGAKPQAGRYVRVGYYNM